MTHRMPRGAAERIRLVALDVDGVLTDNGVFVGQSADGTNVEFKRFEITDGLGVKMLMWSGLEVALISGRQSPATAVRAAELGIECFQDTGARKLPTMQRLLDRHGVAWEEAAFVGDDLADLPVLRRVGLPVAVANAVPEVKTLASWVTRRTGGHGAVREFAEALLRARGQWSALVAEYEKVRETEPVEA